MPRTVRGRLKRAMRAVRAAGRTRRDPSLKGGTSEANTHHDAAWREGALVDRHEWRPADEQLVDEHAQRLWTHGRAAEEIRNTACYYCVT